MSENRKFKTGRIKAISVSKEKGIKKSNVQSVLLKEQFGIIGDAHSGNWHRQVSLLKSESIDRMKEKLPEIEPGMFAENITTEGIELEELKIGDKIKVGKDVMLEVSQIGKECHNPCNIYYSVGYCIMPKEGIFARVISGGRINVGEEIKIIVD
jgi:cyclic pyranopterin phosphate synthase